MTDIPHIMVLGVGNILLTDEGFGIRVIEKMQEMYEFPENVSLVDGGVLGINLLGVLSETDQLIVVDVIRNSGEPGTLYRIDNDEIPQRIRAKNSLHQIDFLETMALCRYGLDKVPETVIFGVEPQDIETCGLEMTPAVSARTDDIISKVLEELTRMGVSYQKKGAAEHVSCHSLKNCGNQQQQSCH
ncbi:MAG: HyaD/HybD family hydrogenase maturation endopeptidase [Desulfococcaceae bacterium]